MRHAVIYPVVLGAAFMLAPFAIDLYLPALPTIADSLQTGIDEIEALFPSSCSVSPLVSCF